MTTIIIIVVVALVFFVTVCVVTFMVWKREAEIRTDSIRAIESNLKKLGDRLTTDPGRQNYSVEDAEYSQELIDMVNRTARRDAPKKRRKRSIDPFGWIRDDAEEHGKAADTDSFEEMMDSFEDMYRKTQEDCEDLFVEKPVQEEELKNNKQQDIKKEPVKGILFDEAVKTSEVAEGKEAADITELINAEGDEAEETAIADIPDESQAENRNINSETETDNILDSLKIDLPELEEYENERSDEAFGEISLDGLGDEMPEEISSHKEAADDDGYISDRLIADSHMSDMDIPEFNERLYDEEPEERTGGHDIGRSGKKYTAEELDMLIKE